MVNEQTFLDLLDKEFPDKEKEKNVGTLPTICLKMSKRTPISNNCRHAPFQLILNFITIKNEFTKEIFIDDIKRILSHSCLLH